MPALAPTAGRLPLVIGLVLATAAPGCSSFKRLSRTQSIAEAGDPATGGSLQLLDPESEAALALTKSATGTGVVARHLDTGQRLLTNGQLDEARTHFEAILAEQPQHAKAHHSLAVIADLQNRFDQAEGHYQTALAQSGEDAQILGDLGYSYLLQNRLDEAETYLKRARQADPTYPNAISNLGLVYAKRGDREKCLAIYRLAGNEEDAQRIVARLFEDQPAATPEAADPSPAAQMFAGLDAAADLSVPAAGSEGDRIRDLEAQIASLRSQAGEAIPKTVTELPSPAEAARQAMAEAADTIDEQTAAIADRFERSMNPQSLADIGLGPAEKAAEQVAAMEFGGSGPAPGGLPSIQPGEAGIGLGQMPEQLAAAAVSGSRPKTPNSPTDPTGPTGPSGPDAGREAMQRQAALQGLAVGSGGGWTLLAVGTAPSPEPPGAKTMFGDGTTPTPLPVATGLASPMPAATAAETVSSATGPGRVVESGGFAGSTGVPSYDPTQSQASFRDPTFGSATPSIAPPPSLIQPTGGNAPPPRGIPTIQPGQYRPGQQGLPTLR